MATKCTGAEFKRFYNDPDWWFSGLGGDLDTYHDDTLIMVDGVEQSDFEADSIPDTAKVTIVCGVVFGKVVGASEPNFDVYFKRWKKAQTTATVLVTCDKALLDSVKAAIVAAGGKIDER